MIEQQKGQGNAFPADQVETYRRAAKLQLIDEGVENPTDEQIKDKAFENAKEDGFDFLE